MLCRGERLFAPTGFYLSQVFSKLILALPVDRISLEMIYRGLDHFSLAHQKGLTDAPIKYFAAPKNRDLGVVKSIGKPRVRLIIAPFLDRPKKSEDFFFLPSSQIPLTNAISA